MTVADSGFLLCFCYVLVKVFLRFLKLYNVWIGILNSLIDDRYCSTVFLRASIIILLYYGNNSPRIVFIFGNDLPSYFDFFPVLQYNHLMRVKLFGVPVFDRQCFFFFFFALVFTLHPGVRK